MVGSEIAQLQPEIIKPQTAPLIEVESSPMLNKITDSDMLLEDSLDGGPPSVGSSEIPTPSVSGFVTNTVTTPVSSKKKSNSRKLVTGYILYSSEVRKQVVQNNPESTFGDISRIVGNEWRSLPANEKLAWEEKAAKLNEEAKLNNLNEVESCPSPAPILQVAPLQDQIYECQWDSCDWQFEDITDCVDHCIAENTGHVQSHFKALEQTEQTIEYQCYWKGCVRIKKSIAPFPTLARLARHVREVHINKGNGKVVPPHDRSKNFIPSSQRLMQLMQQQQAQQAALQHSMPQLPQQETQIPGSQVKAPEPLFVAVPPRPQRVLHSEAYIRYIEGLSTENKHISPWERTLNANSENTVSAEDKLAAPIAWLGNGAGNHGSVVKALWALRDFMMKDSLNLNKNL